MSSIDKLVVKTITRMKKKLSKHGNGVFALESRIVTLRQPSQKTILNDRIT